MESQTIEIGQIYRIKADKENGITPKAGWLFRPKFFIVMGFDNQGNIYGGVVFDSEINRNFVNHDFEDFFLPIPCSKYSFLEHDSYIDCRRMKPSTLTIEMTEVSEAYGVKEQVYASLAESMDNDQFLTYSPRLISGTFRNLERRTTEVGECLNLITNIGKCGRMTEATLQKYRYLLPSNTKQKNE